VDFRFKIADFKFAGLGILAGVGVN